MDVYKAIQKIMLAMSKEGIAKTRIHTQQNYKFRGIDEVMNALSPLLSAEGLIIFPRCISRVAEERETKAGGRLCYVTVEAEFDFVAVSDESKYTVRTFGEAMDSADKATNKAMSAAYKYAAFQTFCIPTEGDNDADQVTHEVLPVAQKPATNGATPPKYPGSGEYLKSIGFDGKAVQDFKDGCKAHGKEWGEVVLLLKARGANAENFKDLLGEILGVVYE